MMLYPAGGYPAEYFPLASMTPPPPDLDVAVLDLIGSTGGALALDGSHRDVLELDGSTGA